MGQISTVTIGTDTFSVYALSADAIADADTFFNGLLGTGSAAWTAASDDDEKRALVMAADWIDRSNGQVFSGEKSVASQAREWPRDGATCYDTVLADGTTPDDVANAQFWLAGQLLVDSAQAAGSGSGSAIKQVVAGPDSVTYVPTAGSATETRLPLVAMDYLICYLTTAGDLDLAGFSSGAGSTNESVFDEDDFERTEGYP